MPESLNALFLMWVGCNYIFAYIITDYRQILDDPTIGSVLINTRHNLRGRLVLEALQAKKHVFVEKSLCITEAEIDEIESAQDASRILMVRFNRHFTAQAQKVEVYLTDSITLLMMFYRINAGFFPSDSWVHNPEVGDGRLSGEICHCVDFIHFMADAAIIRLSAADIGGYAGKYRQDDNLAWTLYLADGSAGTIIYTAKGTKAFSRKRFEVFCEESVGVIEDCRRLMWVQGGKCVREKTVHGCALSGGIELSCSRRYSGFIRKPLFEFCCHYQDHFKGLLGADHRGSSKPP